MSSRVGRYAPAKADLSSGSAGDQVAMAPEFERTCENMIELGANDKAGCVLYSVFCSVLGKISDSHLNT